ncbi:dipeptide ABC transporter ATP-binding protein [Micromonospora olivasterospora]|uniref:Peptide/nickel transport system ATP-binding protein n=1 Tax=Micromonospora olivasterospora TaxID=1880 RepID=A0A562IJB5_MICOL|nr:ABC transporter ATP-binding protein [Micromonospora olivasterospora]TWH71089.1 peptide/nickel transport system ATP-binding protein [Micromonospora olivasterospora]
MNASSPVLAVSNLSVGYRRRNQIIPAVHDVSFAIAPGGRMGLVGESGSGKTTVTMAVLRYLPRNAVVTGGSIELDGEDLLSMGEARLGRLRGRKIAAVYQDPGSSLNPTMTIGRQVGEVFRKHFDMDRHEADRATAEALGRVQLPSPERIATRYPHQLSGGQQQRVMIAMALSTNPALLLLDEPTTGLDATVEAAVIELVEELAKELGTALLMVSHNLPLVRYLCDETIVMKSGRLVEAGPTGQLLSTPRHPYTQALVACVPTRAHRKLSNALRAEGQPERPNGSRRAAQLERALAASDPVLEITDLVKDYETPDGMVHAVRGVSLTMRRGEVLAVVGESGSGKSTLARCVVGLESFTHGSVVIDGKSMPANHRQRDRSAGTQRPTLVFQNPDTSLNPTKTARAVLRRSLRLAGTNTSAVEKIASETELRPEHLESKTRRLSGGLKQRVAIARASVGEPSIVVCDEPVSALDVSVQAAILNLLAHRQAETGVSYLFISHDLDVVHYIADSVAVMYMGDIVERGPAQAVFSGPHHPYTAALMSAATPIGDETRRERIKLMGPTPSAYEHIDGCVFASRCPVTLADGRCTRHVPPWREGPGGKSYKCHRTPQELHDLLGLSRSTLTPAAAELVAKEHQYE